MSEKHSSLIAEVVKIELLKHPDADKLSVVKIDDFACVTQTAQWENRPLLACYIQPDTLVNIKLPEFSFLAKDANIEGQYRIRAKKIRGVNSFGLLVPAPEGAVAGDDLWQLYGLEHWNPPNPEDKETGFTIKGEGETKITISCKPMPIPNYLKQLPKYDLENGKKLARKYLDDDEEVVAREKVHGENCLLSSVDGVQYLRSRTNWKNPLNDFSHVTVEYLLEKGLTEEKAIEVAGKLREKEAQGSACKWWNTFYNQPELGKFCKDHDRYVLFGEMFGGKTQGSFTYGFNERRFIAFDIMTPEGNFLGPLEAEALTAPYNIPWCPTLYKGPFNVEKCNELAEGKTTFANATHVREGVVVEPITPRRNEKVGRVKFKFVGAGYLEKS